MSCNLVLRQEKLNFAPKNEIHPIILEPSCNKFLTLPTETVANVFAELFQLVLVQIFADLPAEVEFCQPFPH